MTIGLLPPNDNTASLVLPTPKSTGTIGWFTNGGGTIAATIVDCDFLNGIIGEFQNLSSAGGTPLSIAAPTMVTNINALIYQRTSLYVQIAGATMTGNLQLGYAYGTLSATPALSVTSSGFSVNVYPRSTGSNLNSIVQANDTAIIYTGGSVNSGGLAIGPWSNGPASGVRFDNNGIATFPQLVRAATPANYDSSSNIATTVWVKSNALTNTSITSYYVNASASPVTSPGTLTSTCVGTWGGGSDITGDGTQAKPYQTIQALIDNLGRMYNFQTRVIDIYLAPTGHSTPYAPYVANGMCHPAFNLWGDELTATNCEIHPTDMIACSHIYSHAGQLIGLYLNGYQSNAGQQVYGVVSQSGAIVSIRNLNFGSLATSQLQAQAGGQITNSSLPASQYRYGYTISCGSQAHIVAISGGVVTIINCTINVPPVVNYTNFIAIESGGLCVFNYAYWSGSWSFSNNAFINPGNIFGSSRWSVNGRLATSGTGLSNLYNIAAPIATGFSGSGSSIFGITASGGLVT